MKYIISSIISVVGIILSIGVLISPLYYVITKDEPLYLLLFLVSPIGATIIAHVFLAIAKLFYD
jgi:hypothetical protein